LPPSDSKAGVASDAPIAASLSGAALPIGSETHQGLTTQEYQRRLKVEGPNLLPDDTGHPVRLAFKKFWAPVPWMLEGAIVLQLALGKQLEASIIGLLLVFNAALGYFQEHRARATLSALKSRLALTAWVNRDGAWKSVPAAEVVPGDSVKLSLGGIVPADVRLVSGSVLLDQSMLTGESLPVEASSNAVAYSGALIRRGEAIAEVTATGVHTKFGQTAELVRTAHSVSSQQGTVLHVVRNLAVFNGVVILSLIIYARFLALPLSDVVPLVLTAFLAAIPVALPATFTLAAALGARALAKLGVLPTRLSAIDEAATMDVLCVDKTGTLTCNALSIDALRPMHGFDQPTLLALAAIASSDAGDDPVDAAIRMACNETASSASASARQSLRLLAFTPFNPDTKMSEATYATGADEVRRVVKGAPAVVLAQAAVCVEATSILTSLQARGDRVLAVASGPKDALQLVGLIGLGDPPRPDSKALITALRGLGIRTVMLTGDGALTAQAVARSVGLEDVAAPKGAIQSGVRPETYSIFAEVLPEDKYALVKLFQRSGHVVGMCGDGANDAPALRQAQMGIAVSTATDVAKSAAGMVLTSGGLQGIVSAVEEGRRTFQRVQTYALNTITSKIVQVLFLAVGLVMTGHAILTPFLIVLIMLTGDFLGMALTTDHVRASSAPDVWRIGPLTVAGAIMGLASLLFCTAFLAYGLLSLRFDIGRLQTLAFVCIVFVKQATTYTNRERDHMWCSRPSKWLVCSSFVDLSLAAILAVGGIAMSALSTGLVAVILGSACVFAFVLDYLKVPSFKRLGIS
jgi:H+-transporting ATPase